jgi:hypothetical protein
MGAPIEAKVKTAAAATMGGVLVLGLVQQYVFKGGPVPPFVEAFVTSAAGSIVTGALTFGVAWLTKHTPRSVISIEQDPLRETPWSDNPTG